MDHQSVIASPLHLFTASPVPPWRLRATFAGKLPPRLYVTPDVRFSNPGWDSEVFNRQIESLEFFLPTGHKIILSGMEAYNFFVEATQTFTRGSRHGARLEAIWLCGKLPAPHPSPFTLHSSPVEMWRIGQGKVIRQRKPWGQEWGGTPTRGWKLGLVGSEPVSTIIAGEALRVTSCDFVERL